MSLHLKVIDRSRPICRHIRTKGMHVYGPEATDAFVTSRSSSYQCLRTQQVTGPDDRLCLPESCAPARECFVAR
ncbi:MAG: hypothetical protein R3A79_20115 [Nannocystaceae bacterium]